MALAFASRYLPYVRMSIAIHAKRRLVRFVMIASQPARQKIVDSCCHYAKNTPIIGKRIGGKYIICDVMPLVRYFRPAHQPNEN